MSLQKDEQDSVSSVDENRFVCGDSDPWTPVYWFIVAIAAAFIFYKYF